MSIHRLLFVLPVTCGDKDVGKDDKCWQKEAGSLRDPPPQVIKRA